MKEKLSAVITLFRMFIAVGMRLFCKRERSVLFYNTSGFIISPYMSCLQQLSYSGLDVPAVSVFRKKSDLCGLRFFWRTSVRFSDPP